jgi:hypothetical protein
MTETTETPKTTRKGRTIRKTNAATDTAEATVLAPTESTDSPESQPSPSLTGQQIVLIDSRLTQLTDGWGKLETKDARSVVLFAMSQMVGAAESKMSIGEKFNEFSEKHGDKVNILIRETAKLGISGLTESNIVLWRIRARELPKHIPNALVRKYALLLTGGEGLIIRDENYDEKDSEGKPKPKPYILSPFWAEAFKATGAIPSTQNEEVAEVYARKVAAQASFLRSKARTTPEDARIRKQFATFQKRSIGWLSKHESLVYECLYKMLGAVAKETTDLQHIDALLGKLDKMFDAVSEANGEEYKPKPASKPAARVA